MAKLTPAKKNQIFRELNRRELPWPKARFVVDAEDNGWLGNGNFSEVYLMEDIEDTSVKYAVKIIGFNENRRIHQADISLYKKEPIMQYTLAQKCDTIVQISHTEILSIELDDDGGVLQAIADDSGVDKPGWLVLVMIRMEKLEPIIEQNFSGDYRFTIPALERAEESEILKLSVDIAKALEASHRYNIMHRDVKLENIFYDAKTGSYKLGDFGIARITNQGSASTKGAGTLGYEAPEVEGRDDGKYSLQADLYSFGITIYLLMNNHRFPGSSGYHVNRSVQYHPNGVIGEPSNGSPELKKLICSLIQFDPNARGESMTKVLEKLRQISSGEALPVDAEEEQQQQVAGSGSQEQKPEQPQKTSDTVLTEVAGPEKTSKEPETTQNRGDIKPNTRKGILGSFFFGLGLLLLALAIEDTTRERFFPPLLCVTLIFNTVISIVAVIRKRKNKKIPFLIYLLLFGVFVYLKISSDISWLYLICAVSLFVDGVTVKLAASITAWLYALLMSSPLHEIIGSVDLIKYAWIFMIFSMIGFVMTEQHDQQGGLCSIIFGNTYSVCFVSVLSLFIGCALKLVSLIPGVQYGRVLSNLHFVYSAGVLMILGIISSMIDEGRKNGGD